MSHAFARLHYHLIFSTKQRKGMITPDLQPRLHAYLAGIIRNLEGVAHEIGGIEDHVHLLFFTPPKLALSDVIGTIKANSSKWIHETWPERREFAWQRGYGVFSVSESQTAAVRAYIQNQPAHHQRQSFQEEFVEYLRKHEFEYDDQDLWD